MSNTPSFQCLESESLRFRTLLDKFDKTESQLLIPDFPIMCCVNASMLLMYHFLSLWPDSTIYGVRGFCDDENDEQKISHFWLEVGGYCIDITGDQYNLFNERELNRHIIANRPFPSVHIGEINRGALYEIFNITPEYQREAYIAGYPNFGTEYVEMLRLDYESIVAYESA